MIKLVVLDVDGTLTDGKLYIDNMGNEMKAFDVKDGLAISQSIKQGIKFAIITGKTSKIVERRGKGTWYSRNCSRKLGQSGRLKKDFRKI